MAFGNWAYSVSIVLSLNNAAASVRIDLARCARRWQATAGLASSTTNLRDHCANRLSHLSVEYAIQLPARVILRGGLFVRMQSPAR